MSALAKLTLTPATRGFATGLPSWPGAATATVTNAANVLSGLCHWTVPDGSRYLLVRPHLHADPAFGEGALRPLVKLFDNAGVEAGRTGALVLAVQRPIDDEPQPIGRVAYENWHALTLVQQADRNNQGVLAFDFRMPGGMEPGDILELTGGSHVVLMAHLDRSISFAVAALTRLSLPGLRGTWAGGV